MADGPWLPFASFFWVPCLMDGLLLFAFLVSVCLSVSSGCPSLSWVQPTNYTHTCRCGLATGGEKGRSTLPMQSDNRLGCCADLYNGMAGGDGTF